MSRVPISTLVRTTPRTGACIRRRSSPARFASSSFVSAQSPTTRTTSTAWESASASWYARTEGASTMTTSARSLAARIMPGARTTNWALFATNSLNDTDETFSTRVGCTRTARSTEETSVRGRWALQRPRSSGHQECSSQEPEGPLGHRTQPGWPQQQVWPFLPPERPPSRLDGY